MAESRDEVPPLLIDPTSEVLTDRLPASWRSTEEMRALFAQTPIASWVIDFELGRVFTNAATARLFRFDPDDASVVGNDIYAMLPYGERDRTVNELQQLLNGELDRVSRIKHYVRPDGTEFDGQLESVPLLDEQGHPWAVLSTCRDVTLQREAERALVRREAWFEALVRHNVDGIIVVDRRACSTYISPSADELIGSAAGTRLGQSALDLVHQDDFDVVSETFAAIVESPGTTGPLRFRIVRPDGEVRLVEAVATNLLDDPAVGGVVLNVRDLTDREQVATALEVSENRFRKMLENIADTVTLLDEAGQVIRTTGNVKSILGYPTEFWSTRNAFDITHPDDVDLIRRMFAELLETPGGTVHGEFRVRHASGHHEYVEADAINLLADPEVGSIVVTTRNITSRKQSERELAEARDQALRALDVRNEFVASVSHELRTPIHGILGLAELMATSSDAGEELVHLALSIRRATESLRLVLDDILDFTKIEAGRLELDERPTSLREVVDDIEVLFRHQSIAKGIALEVHADESLPATFVADGLRLRQVLNNLVSNAVKFTRSGKVSVSFRRGGADAVEQLLVEVADTGIGMGQEIVQQIFEPFSQAHAATARDYGGTGLGLTIARRLIELMQGELLVDSEVGRGTVFEVVLPLRTREQMIDSSPYEPLEADHPTGKQRVLVVEDNTVNQLLVGRQLERLGYESVVVGSGEAAVELFAQDLVDAVLMDWQMPGMDGIEAAGRLRRLETDTGRGRVPIIAMTASAMLGDRERCIAAGMDDFISKPVNLATLGRTLAAWLFPVDRTAVDEARGGATREPTDPLDPAVLDRLLDELDDPDLVATVVRTYCRELPGRIEAIEDSARALDLETLATVAHTLKSTSAALGATRLAQLCADLEEFARSKSLAFGHIEPLLSKLTTERLQVEQALADQDGRFGH